MIQKNPRSSLILNSIIIVFLLFSIHLVNNNPSFKRPKLKISMQDTKRSLHSDFYKIINLGQKRLLSSLLWIDTILSMDHENYKNQDLYNWMYLRFQTITDLDRYFYQAYRNGGPILSVIKDDDLGALKIYDKGLEVFPGDVNLLFYAGIHAFFELHDDALAIKYLDQIKDQKDVPKNLPSLISKLKASEGDLSGAYALLYTAYSNTDDDSNIKLHFAKGLYALKSEIDLHCLNNKKKNCETKDFEGNFYLLGLDQKYYAAKQWEPIRPSDFRYKNKKKKAPKKEPFINQNSLKN